MDQNRQASFVEGRMYRVTEDVVASTEPAFHAGETFKFIRQAYSPYDEAYTLEFEDKGGSLRTLWISRDENPDKFQGYFRLVD